MSTASLTSSKHLATIALPEEPDGTTPAIVTNGTLARTSGIITPLTVSGSARRLGFLLKNNVVHPFYVLHGVSER
jgi:hypothetical protein